MCAYIVSIPTYEPWGPLATLALGNGITEIRGATVDTYAYATNGIGNSPVLDEIDLGLGGTADYTHGPAGHLELVDRSANVIDFSWTAYSSDGLLG